jgi:hypothetical protein
MWRQPSRSCSACSIFGNWNSKPRGVELGRHSPNAVADQGGLLAEHGLSTKRRQRQQRRPVQHRAAYRANSALRTGLGAVTLTASGDGRAMHEADGPTASSRGSTTAIAGRRPPGRPPAAGTAAASAAGRRRRDRAPRRSAGLPCARACPPAALPRRWPGGRESRCPAARPRRARLAGAVVADAGCLQQHGGRAAMALQARPAPAGHDPAVDQRALARFGPAPPARLAPHRLITATAPRTRAVLPGPGISAEDPMDEADPPGGRTARRVSTTTVAGVASAGSRWRADESAAAGDHHLADAAGPRSGRRFRRGSAHAGPFRASGGPGMVFRR